MKWSNSVFCVLPIVALLTAGSASATIPSAERAALVDLYNSTSGASWVHNTNWLGVVGTECTWYGVNCDPTESTVTSLVLNSNGLSGPLPTTIGDFTGLEYLNLRSNSLTGSIPIELGYLSSLVNLNVGYNGLTGEIPSSVEDLSSLQEMNFQFNQLTGIPPELGNLPNLSVLWLKANQLGGSIPPELGNLQTLTTLWLGQNHLSGSIPPELGNLANLQYLILNSNQLSGNAPPELGDLSNLQVMDLTSNQLSGRIPSEWASLSGSSPFVEVGYNALWTNDPAIDALLSVSNPSWYLTQTIAPADVAAGSETSSSFVVNWTPIPYTADDGWYEISDSTIGIFFDGFETGDTSRWGAPAPTSPGLFTTVDKTDNSILVDGLQPNTEYQFVVRTITEPHVNNQNQVVSEESAVVLVTTTP